MLAQAINADQLHTIAYPKILQVKLDGIRGTLWEGGLYSRSGKLLPNHHIQNFMHSLLLECPELLGMDGELLVGEPNDPRVFSNTTSAVMSRDGTPDFKFHAFDWVRDAPYFNRRRALSWLIDKLPDTFARVVLVGEWLTFKPEEVQERLSALIDQGIEGCILRAPEGHYKAGRSTLKEGLLLKMKDIRDTEGVVVGFEERCTNDNEAVTDALGYTKRSSHQAGKTLAGDLGALVVRSPKWEKPFRIGTGFDAAARVRIWENQKDYKGRIVKFKYLHIGMKDLPRHPVFLAWRAMMDIDPMDASLLRGLGAKDG
jgi:DNA ligase-1